MKNRSENSTKKRQKMLGKICADLGKICADLGKICADLGKICAENFCNLLKYKSLQGHFFTIILKY